MSERRESAFVRVTLAATILLLFLAAALAAPRSAAALGEVVWSAQYSANAGMDGFQDVARGPAGAIYCAGFTKGTEESSTLLLIKYVDGGATVDRKWVKRYTLHGVTGSRATEVEVDGSGNVIVAGTVGVAPPASAKGRDIIVLKYSAGGTLKWKHVYNGPAHRDDYVTGMALDRYGNACVSGAARGAHSGLDYVTLKVRANGSRAWAKRYVGPGGYDEARGVAVDTAGNVYVTGESKGGSGKPRAVTIKYSGAGLMRWGRVFLGNVAGARTSAIAVRKVAGATTVIVAGSMWNGNLEGGEILLVKYNATSGATKWWRTIGNGDAFNESAQQVAIDPLGDPVAAGTTEDENLGVTHGFMAGLSAAGSGVWSNEFWSGAPGSDAQFQALALDGVSVYAGGWAQTVGAGADFAVKYLFRLIGPGDWATVINGTANGDDVCRAIVVGPLGAYAAGEVTNAGSGVDAVLVKF